MKPFFHPFFAVFTFAVFAVVVLAVDVQADQSVVPAVRYLAASSNEAAMFHEAVMEPLTPLAPIFPWQDRPQVPNTALSHTVEPYIVERPTEKTMAVPQPLEAPPFPVSPVPAVPFAPVLPKQDSPVQNADTTPVTIRGQSRTLDDVAGILAQPPPVARGAVDIDMVEPKLIESINTPELPDPLLPANPATNPAQSDSAKQGTTITDPVGYGVLVFVAALTSLGLVWMVFVAFDYRQRWMQSQTLQNDRYLGGGGYDTETEDIYRDYLAGTPAR